MKRAAPIGILLILTVAAAVPAPAATPDRQPAPALRILHSADGQGEISPCGG